MARIKITDLPLLQDLTEEQLKELFGAGAKSYKPSFEALEDRRLMSGFSSLLDSAPTLDAPASSAPAAHTSAQFAINLPPMQVISPVSPVGSVALQTQANPYAALQDPALATVRDGPSNALPPFADSQEAGQAAIDGLARDLTAKGLLGKSVRDAQPSADGVGRFQQFEQGKWILWSPFTGAHMMEGAIAVEMINTPGLGYPTSEAFTLPGRPPVSNPAVAQYFLSASSRTASLIVWTERYSAHVITGPILDKYLALGGGAYGVPMASAHNLYHAEGSSQDFTWEHSSEPGVLRFATIVTSQKTGTHDVAGPTNDRWQALGASGIGTPTTDSTVLTASGTQLNSIVHFRTFYGAHHYDSALGTTRTGTYWVKGEIYTAWYSNGAEKILGTPTSDEEMSDLNPPHDGFGITYLVSRFRTDQGINTAIYWSFSPAKGESQFYVNRGGGQGALPLGGFTPRSGPTGFEPVDGATGTTGAPLKTDPPLDLSSLFQDSIYATTDTTGLRTLDLSGLVQNSTQATVNLPSAISTAASTASVLQSSAAVIETDPVGGNRANYIPPDPHFPLWLASDQVSSAADLASAFADPFAADIGLWPEYTPGPAIPPVLAEAGVARANPMADFSNVNFSLTSLDTGAVHQLQMQSQSNWLPAGTADRQRLPGPSADRQRVPGAPQATITFTALWDPANEGGFQATGTLSHDDAGIVHIQFNWGSLDAGTFHTFIGTITGAAGSYHIEGTATPRPGGVDDPMSGDQTPPTPVSTVEDLTAASFTVTAPDGTTHQLAILTQTGQADGSATFTGLWDDGATQAETLAYDAAGNIHITFTLSDGSSVDGIISGQPGAHHIEAVVTPADGSSSIPVVGDQDQPVDGVLPGPVLLLA